MGFLLDQFGIDLFHVVIFTVVFGFFGAGVLLFYVQWDPRKQDRILEGHVTTAIEEAEKHLRRAQQNFTRLSAKLSDTKSALDVIQRALDSGYEHRKLREMESSLKKSISLMLGETPAPAPAAKAAPAAAPPPPPAAPEPAPAPVREIVRADKERRGLREMLRRVRGEGAPLRFRAQKPTILLIHADEEERRVVREMIEEIDPAIRTIAVDGTQDVVQLVDDNKVDVILTGIKMGPVNGLQLVAEVKKAYPWVEAIVVSWTSYLHKAEAADVGAYACLDKPLVTSVFRETLMRCIVDRVARNEWRRKGRR